VQFEVNGKQYFLAFVEDERQWYVFSPAARGVERMPVYVDAVKYERNPMTEPSRKASN